MPNSIKVAGLKHIADNLLKATLGTLSLRLGLGLGIFWQSVSAAAAFSPSRLSSVVSLLSGQLLPSFPDSLARRSPFLTCL